MVETVSNDHAMTSDIPASPTPYDRYRGLRIDHQPTSAVAFIEGITMILIFLGSLIVNILALTTILRDKILRRNIHNWLIVNLIVNDLGITITSMSFSIGSVFDHGHFLVHNDAMCLINGIGGTGFAFGNFFTILAISVDRYLTVVWSNRFPPSKARIIVFIILSWVFPIANIIPPSFELISDFKYHPFTHHCSPIWQVCLYYIICNIILFGITVPVMVFCYIGVFWVLRRQQQLLKSYASKNDHKNVDDSRVNNSDMSVDDMSRSHKGSTSLDVSETVEVLSLSNIDDSISAGNRGLEGSNANRQEKQVKKKEQSKMTTDKRIALTGVLLVMTTVVCWAPYGIVHSCFIDIHVTHSLGVFTMWLAYTNSLFDPLIYSFMNRRVRARYLAMMRGLRKTGCHLLNSE